MWQAQWSRRQRTTKVGTCRRNRKFPTTRTTRHLLTSLADMDGNRTLTPGLLLCTPTPGLLPHLRWTNIPAGEKSRPLAMDVPWVRIPQPFSPSRTLAQTVVALHRASYVGRTRTGFRLDPHERVGILALSCSCPFPHWWRERSWPALDICKPTPSTPSQFTMALGLPINENPQPVHLTRLSTSRLIPTW